MKFLSALHNVQLGDSRMKRITSILLAGALVSVTIGVLSLNPENVIAQPENSPWPMFRGDARHTGRSPYDTSHVDGTVKWSFETGDGIESSPAIGSDGTVYVGSWDNNLYAINPDGTEKWHFTTGGLVRSSPAIGADGTIYVGSFDGNFYAVNPDGTEKWHLSISASVSSPAIGSDGTIYVGSWDHKLYAIGGPTAPENLPADNDNDGMPDNWESQYELDPNTDDASQDKDGDGYTNLQEYQAGTNPSLASSYPGAGEGGVTPPAEGIPIIYVIVGVAAIVIAAGVVLVFRR